MKQLLFGVAIAALLAGVQVRAQETTQEQAEAYFKRLMELSAGLKYQEGEVTLPGGMAKLHLPEGLRYLDPKDADTVIYDIWGNPPGGKKETLGMLVPTGMNPRRPIPGQSS